MRSFRIERLRKVLDEQTVEAEDEESALETAKDRDEWNLCEEEELEISVEES